MFVVWKRPDGYHDATPSDFQIVEAGANARIWLHKSDREWYPFRISGGWQESDATRRLNGLVNLPNPLMRGQRF
jgi:elongation factor P hydroxylase